MKISVIVLSKSIDNLRPCLEALARHDPGTEVIVVDDGLESRPDFELINARYLDGAKPFVYARNVNIGINEAYRHAIDWDANKHLTPAGRVLSNDENPDGVVLLNDDAILKSTGGFSLLAKTARQNSEYGLIGGVTNVTGNRNQKPMGIGFRDEPRMLTFLCVYIPCGTLVKCGLLDERYIGYGCDDDDYSFTVRSAGLKLAVHDGCYVDHGSLKSSFRGDPRTPADFHPNLQRFIAKWGHDNWGRKAA